MYQFSYRNSDSNHFMNPVPPPSIYVDDKYYEITIDPSTSLDSAG